VKAFCFVSREHTRLGVLTGAAKAFVAIGGLAGLRLGEIQGLEWPDIRQDEIMVSRSIWRGNVDDPKTEASKAPVPMVPRLREILEEYREGRVVGRLFEMELEKFEQRVVKPIVEAISLKWYGAQALRRGIATNLYSLGASDKIVQRILRHAKANVTREHYIKSVPKDVNAAMQKMGLALTGAASA
jgi:integrase